MRITDIVGYRAATACPCLLLLGLLLLGCSDPGNTVGMAEQVADAYYQAIKNKDFEGASTLFMDTSAMPRAQWLDQIREYHGKLGDLESHELVSTVASTVYSGTRYTLQYKTKYSKFPASETLILFDGVSTFGDSPNVLQVEGLVIRSPGL